MKPQSERPDWIQVLEQACKASSQSEVARRLGFSPTAINQVLKGTYKASTARVEAKVRGALMQETVRCPVLGEMAKDQCQDEQGMGFYASPLRTALYRACKTCPHAIPAKEKP